MWRRSRKTSREDDSSPTSIDRGRGHRETTRSLLRTTQVLPRRDTELAKRRNGQKLNPKLQAQLDQRPHRTSTSSSSTQPTCARRPVPHRTGDEHDGGTKEGRGQVQKGAHPPRCAVQPPALSPHEASKRAAEAGQPNLGNEGAVRASSRSSRGAERAGQEPKPRLRRPQFSLGWGCDLSLIATCKQCSSFERARQLGE